MSLAANLSNVSHRFSGAGALALADIDLKVESGAVVALIGPSGAGKSTLLALLGGQLAGWKGTASVLGARLNSQRPPARKDRVRVGFIFQEFALIERASARQNVLNGRLGRTDKIASLFGRFSDADHNAVDAALEDAGIAELADQRVDQISGGQRQRVAIARALAQEPQLILADEPVSNLDPARAETILELITSRARDAGATVIFTSHQPDLVARFASRVVGLKGGKIAFDSAPATLKPAEIAALYDQETGAQIIRRFG